MKTESNAGEERICVNNMTTSIQMVMEMNVCGYTYRLIKYMRKWLCTSVERSGCVPRMWKFCIEIGCVPLV